MAKTIHINSKKDNNQEGRSSDNLWQKFLECDAHLDKLQEDRANFWISQSGDPVREKAAIEMIEKELNPEIDKVSAEVNEKLAAFQAAKGNTSKNNVEDENGDSDDVVFNEDGDGEETGQEGEEEENQ